MASRKTLGKTVQGILDFAMELYTSGGVDNINDIESALGTAKVMANMYELNEEEKVDELVAWMNEDLYRDGHTKGFIQI